jgi:hypothetical protein
MLMAAFMEQRVYGIDRCFSLPGKRRYRFSRHFSLFMFFAGQKGNWVPARVCIVTGSSIHQIALAGRYWNCNSLLEAFC